MPGDSSLIPPTSSAPPNPPSAAATAASSRSFATHALPRPTISPIPPPHHLHYPPQAIYAPQQIPIRIPTQQFPKLLQDSQSVLYPLASSGRGFGPRPVRPGSVDPFSHLPVLTFPHQPQPQPLSGSIKGVAVSSDSKVLPPSACESNGCKEMRDKIRDDTLCVIRDRKVRITEGASLYALCRSWLRNGSLEESQPQYGKFFKSLPRPLPIPVTNVIPLQKKEVVEEEENGGEEDKGAIENLSPQEILKRHVRRAKNVRSRLREERLRRIERYKTRLALLLPPPIEQLRTDNTSGSCIM